MQDMLGSMDYRLLTSLGLDVYIDFHLLKMPDGAQKVRDQASCFVTYHSGSLLCIARDNLLILHTRVTMDLLYQSLDDSLATFLTLTQLSHEEEFQCNSAYCKSI